MAKRKSVTGVRKKPPKPAPSKASVAKNQPNELLSHSSLTPGNPPRPRELLSTRRIVPDRALRRKPQSKQIDKPRIKHISQNTIRSKWILLNEDAQARVETLFRSVELPVLAKHLPEQKKVEAQATLGSVTRTLSKRLPKMPFPPKTKEVHFDYEALVKSNRDLQQRLTTSMKITATISDDFEKQKLALATEKQDLEDLDNN